MSPVHERIAQRMDRADVAEPRTQPDVGGNAYAGPALNAARRVCTFGSACSGSRSGLSLTFACSVPDHGRRPVREGTLPPGVSVVVTALAIRGWVVLLAVNPAIETGATAPW